MKNIKAFSMAEVLTVLSIIGLISALTIPSLNTSISKQKSISLLKKTYASFLINIQTVLNTYPCSSVSCTRTYGNTGYEIDGVTGEKEYIAPDSHNGIFGNAKYFDIQSTCANCFAPGSILPGGMKISYNDEQDLYETTNDTLTWLGKDLPIKDYPIPTDDYSVSVEFGKSEPDSITLSLKNKDTNDIHAVYEYDKDGVLQKKYWRTNTNADGSYSGVTVNYDDNGKMISRTSGEYDADGNVVSENPEDIIVSNFTAYILQNSVSVALYDYPGNCIKTFDDVKNDGQNIDLCGVLVIDTNANNGPNSPGIDRFGFYITDEPVNNSYLLPFGYSRDDEGNVSPYNDKGLITSLTGGTSCLPGTLAGYNCTAKIMTSGWKKNY